MTRRQLRSSSLLMPYARALTCAAALALLSACASQGPTASVDDNQTAAAMQYAAHARGDYTPPGPPDDPWGPYINEAAKRFDVPDQWIRAVMAVESNGQEYQDGHFIISPKGAMGLMQVMPATYDDMRQEYNLGDDPYDPHNNILAGAAYLRQMYDMYGYPGFLAAYNAGPHRLDDYLSNERPLPAETRRYVAMIAPNIEGIYPDRRSPAEAYAMNHLPIDIPPGTRYGGIVQVAESRSRSTHHHNVRLARLPEPPAPAPAPAPRVLLASNGPARHEGRRHGFHLISQAYAEPAPASHGTGWAVQVGAYGRQYEAVSAVHLAKQEAHADLGSAHSIVASVHAVHATLWRARLTGLSRDSAVRACAALARSRKGCIVLSPEAQS
ncbi:MAG: lytic transglycosylase domain-containing protein [Acetobacteraceae bacterium]|nr:lytic transglycosylase domain-containing protein [Acetobacteraceae bacterium]